MPMTLRWLFFVIVLSLALPCQAAPRPLTNAADKHDGQAAGHGGHTKKPRKTK